MSDDLTTYFSLQDRIVELEKQLIEEAEKVTKLTKKQYKLQYKYNKLYEKYNGEKPITRSQKAVILIKAKGDLSLREIADKCFITYSSVLRLSMRVSRGIYD